MKYELLKTIPRRTFFDKNKIWDRGLSAEKDLVHYLIEQNLTISVLDYLEFKLTEYSLIEKKWYISNFVIETTENEYKVFCRYKQFSKEGDK